MGPSNSLLPSTGPKAPEAGTPEQLSAQQPKGGGRPQRPHSSEPEEGAPTPATPRMSPEGMVLGVTSEARKDTHTGIPLT